MQLHTGTYTDSYIHTTSGTWNLEPYLRSITIGEPFRRHCLKSVQPKVTLLNCAESHEITVGSVSIKS